MKAGFKKDDTSRRRTIYTLRLITLISHSNEKAKMFSGVNFFFITFNSSLNYVTRYCLLCVRS